MPGKVKGLFKWCRKVTDGYDGVDLTNMTSSWRNGLALCALINRFRPDLIDFYSLSPENVFYNNDLAFTVAERELGIPKYLDPVDMETMESPDRFSMATYLAEFYEHFRDKPMHDPPEMPSGWPDCVPVLPKSKINTTTEHEYVDKSKEQRSEVFDNLKHSKPQIDVGSNTNKAEQEEKEIRDIGKDIQLENNLNDDIDDLYQENLELMKSENSNVKSFSEVCKEEINEFKMAKKGAVLQAVVCAGITAVAATTVGDDTENYDSDVKEGSAETLNVSDSSLVVQENIEGDVEANLKKYEPRGVENEEICKDAQEVSAKPDLSRSDSGFGTASTEVLGETLKNIKPIEKQIVNEICNADKEECLETPLCSDVCTQKTVELLNSELNKGELQIVDVNVIESKSADNSDTEIHSLENVSIKQDETEVNGVLTDSNIDMTSKVKEHVDSNSSSSDEADTELDEKLQECLNSNSSIEAVNTELGENLTEHPGSCNSSSESETNAKKSAATEPVESVLEKSDSNIFLPDDDSLVKNLKEPTDTNSYATELESDIQCIENIKENTENYYFKANKDIDIKVKANVREHSDSSSSSSDSESDASELFENKKEHLDSDGTYDKRTYLENENKYQESSSSTEPDIECIENSDKDKGVDIELEEEVNEQSSENNVKESELTENMKEHPDGKSSFDNESDVEYKESEHQDRNGSSSDTEVNIEYVEKLKEHLDNESSTFSKEKNVNLESMKELPDSNRSSSESETNAEESFASDLVENIFHEVKSNPDLIAEITKELPSIVKEVQSGLVMDSDSYFINEPEYESANQIEIELPKSVDVKIKVIPDEMEISVPAEVEINSKISSNDTEIDEEIEEIDQKTLQCVSTPSVLCSENSTDVLLTDRECDLQEGHENEASYVINDMSLPAIEQDTDPRMLTSEGSSSSTSSDVEGDETKTNADAIEMKHEEIEQKQDIKAESYGQESVVESKQKLVLLAHSCSSSSSESESDHETDAVAFKSTESCEVKENLSVNSGKEEIQTAAAGIDNDAIFLEGKLSGNDKDISENCGENLKFGSRSSSSQSSDEGDNPELIDQTPAGISGSSLSVAPEVENTGTVENMIEDLRKSSVASDLSKSTSNSDSEGEPPALPVLGPPQLVEKTESDNSDDELITNPLQSNKSEEHFKLMEEIVVDVNVPADVPVTDKGDKLDTYHVGIDKQSDEEDKTKSSAVTLDMNKVGLIEHPDVVSSSCGNLTERQNINSCLKSQPEESGTKNKDTEPELPLLPDSKTDVVVETVTTEDTQKIVHLDKLYSSSSSSQSDEEDDTKLIKMEAEIADQPLNDSSHELQLSLEAKTYDIGVDKADKQKNLSETSSSSSSSESEAEVETSKLNSKDIGSSPQTLGLVNQLNTKQLEMNNTIDAEISPVLSTKTEVKPRHTAEISVLPIEQEIEKPIASGNVNTDLFEEGTVARPAVPDVKLELSKTTQSGDGVPKEKESGKSKYFANVDTDLMKKAALMSRKMAQSITSKMEDQKKLDAGLSDMEKSHIKEEEASVDTPPSTQDQEERRAKKLAMFRKLQFSTRPTKKKFEESPEGEGSSDSDSGFRSKLQMFSRKSTNEEPDRSKLIYSDSGNVLRKKISSPFLQSPTSPPADDQKHLKKLHECLPESPAPGSVAEYIRKISQSSMPKHQDEIRSPVNTFERCIEDGNQIEVPIKKQTVDHSESLPSTDIFTQQKKAMNAENSEENKKIKINPSSIFAGRPIIRRHTLQDKKLPVRPMSIELKNDKNDKEHVKDQDKPPIPPPRFHRKKQEKLNVNIEPLEMKPDSCKKNMDIEGDSQNESDGSGLRRSGSFNDKVSVEVKSLEKQPTLSDEEKQEKEKKSELKRQESLKRRQSPRRSLIMSSPTRADTTDGERVRNIWQDPLKKPPSPKIKRHNSFEVKVRPVTQQLTPEEKENVKKKKALERSNSFNSDISSRPPTPTKSNQKLPVVIKPLSAQNSHDKKDENPDSADSMKYLLTQSKSESRRESDASDVNNDDEAKIIDVKPPRDKKKSSILSIVEKMTHPKIKVSNENPPIVDEIIVVKSLNNVDALPPRVEMMTTLELNQDTLKSNKKVEVTPVSQKSVSGNTPNILQDKTDENRRSQSFTESDIRMSFAEDKNALELNKSDAGKKTSKFKEEQDEAIRKCNSIFGLVKARVKPFNKVKDKELPVLAGDSINRSVKPLPSEETTKGEGVDVDKYGSENIKIVSENKDLPSSSSSSSSNSRESSPLSTPNLSRKDVNIHVNGDSNNLDDSNESFKPNLNENELEKAEDIIFEAEAPKNVKLPENIRDESATDEMDKQTLDKKETEKSVENTSSESDDEEKIFKDTAKSMTSSPSSQSSAEIQKQDLRAGLKTIISDLEKDMKSDEENEPISKDKDSVKQDKGESQSNNSVKAEDEIDDADSMTTKEMKDSSKEEEDVETVQNAAIQHGAEGKEGDRNTSQSESSSSSDDDDKKLIKNEYKRLLNEPSLEDPNKSEGENYLKTTVAFFSEGSKEVQDMLKDNDKIEMNTDGLNSHDERKHESEQHDDEHQQNVDQVIKHETDGKDRTKKLTEDEMEKNASDSICDSFTSENSGQENSRKKQKKKKKKKRKESVTSSSSESSQTDSDKDDDTNGEGTSRSDTSSSADKTKSERAEDGGGQSEDRDRKSSTGSNKSSQSSNPKDAHVISIEIPGESDVIVEHDASCHEIKKEISNSAKSESPECSSSSPSETEQEKFDQVYKRNSLTGTKTKETPETNLNDSQYIYPNISLEVTANEIDDKDYHADEEHSDTDEEEIREVREVMEKISLDKEDTEPVLNLVLKDASYVSNEDESKNLRSASTSDTDSSHYFSADHLSREENLANEENYFPNNDSEKSLNTQEDQCFPRKLDACFGNLPSTEENMKIEVPDFTYEVKVAERKLSSFSSEGRRKNINPTTSESDVEEERKTSSSSSSDSEDESSPKDLLTKDDVLPVNVVLSDTDVEDYDDIPVVDTSVKVNSTEEIGNTEETVNCDNEVEISTFIEPSNGLQSVIDASHVLKQIDDKVKRERPLSCSSSESGSSSKSSTDENVVKEPVFDEAGHDVEEDELLKSVIEDAEPFRAPLLEDAIMSGSLEKSEEIEENVYDKADKKSDDEKKYSCSSSESSETDSSDDLYSDSKSKPAPAQYILPECNKILTEFEGLQREDFNPGQIDVQVFVIPDAPVDRHLYPSLKDPEILIPNNYSNTKDVSEENEEVVISLEPVLFTELKNETNLLERTNVAEVVHQDEDGDVKDSVKISEVVLEPLEETKHDITEIEDELLQNIILQNEMNLTSIEKRKSSTSSLSSTDDHKIYVYIESESGSDNEQNKNIKHDGIVENESEVKADPQEIEVGEIAKGKYTPYENVVIIKKPDSSFDTNIELVLKDDEMNGSSSDFSDNKSDIPCTNKTARTSSCSSSSSSAHSDAIGLNEVDIKNEIFEEIESRNRSYSSNSSSSSSSDSKSGEQEVDIQNEIFEEIESRSRSYSSSSSSSSDSKSGEQELEAEHNSEFLIGREKDPSKSEVARLIQQSLEIDRRREELRKQEQDRLKVAQELHDQFKPRDEVLEHEHIRHLSEASSRDSRNEDNVDLDESSVEDDVEEAEAEMSEELLAGEATPLSMPSAADSDTTDSSPDEAEGKPVIEVLDLQESSPDDISPDMESQALFVKLKEAQCKNAVLEAEITKLKAKLVVLENNEAQKKQYEKKNEEMASRLREMEKSLTNARKEINHYQDMMEGSQGQYIALEKKLKAEYIALEKKYHKAKKLIKEYQQREKDFIAERESLLQQQSEKDQQYDALVKSLKDRIFHLEGELGEAQKAAGLPVLLPPQDQTHAIEATVVPSVSVAVKSAPKTHDSGSPVLSPLADGLSISSESDTSVAEPLSTSPAIDVKIPSQSAITFESIPAPKLLDTSVNRAKAQLAANSPRRPPTKQRSKSQDSEEMIEAISENKPESGLETWIKHDSDNTVKKSDVRKRKAQQNESHLPPPVSETPPIIAEAQPKVSEAPPSIETVPAPPPPLASPPELPDLSDDMETPRDRCNSESGESSSTLSQTSYDPSRPAFRNKDSEIPGLDAVSTDTTGTNDTAETSESSSSATAANKKAKGLLPKLPFKFGGSDRDKGGGVMLVSQRSIGSDDPASAGERGITLISKKKIDTGLDFDGASTISDSSSGYMVGEVEQSSYSFSGTPASEDHPSQPGHHTLNQFSSGQITEWNNENVRHWLIGIEMERYAPLFTEKSVTGPQLVAMDSNKLKALGVTNAKDRDYLKKKVKELKLVLEKERKQIERERKQMEKEQKQREKEQKKLFKKK